MSLYLTKFLTLLIAPLGLGLILGLAALVLIARGRRRAAAAVLVVQVLLLWVCAMPWTAYHLVAGLERDVPRVALEETPEADVAVVLGGAVAPVGDPPVENLTGSSDRVLRAARLYRMGKVDYVLAVGGNQPWLGASTPEAELIRDLLIEWGVPEDAIRIETTSLNTRENAVRAAEIIRHSGWLRVLLVSSASHIPRAVAEFQQAGIQVIPSPTDFSIVGPLSVDLLDFLPDAGALGGVTSAIREHLGRWVQGRRAGRLRPVHE